MPFYPHSAGSAQRPAAAAAATVAAALHRGPAGGQSWPLRLAVRVPVHGDGSDESGRRAAAAEPRQSKNLLDGQQPG